MTASTCGEGWGASSSNLKGEGGLPAPTLVPAVCRPPAFPSSPYSWDVPSKVHLQASIPVPLSLAAWLLSLPGQPVSEGATLSWPGNVQMGISTHASLSFSLLHQAAEARSVLLSSPSSAPPPQNPSPSVPGILYQLLPSFQWLCFWPVAMEFLCKSFHDMLLTTFTGFSSSFCRYMLKSWRKCLFWTLTVCCL